MREVIQYESQMTEDCLGEIREQADGIVTTYLATDAGVLYSVRYTNMDIRVMFAYEKRELWYANTILFCKRGSPAMDVETDIGPYATFGLLSRKVLGEKVEVANPLDIEYQKPAVYRESTLAEKAEEISWDEYATDNEAGQMRDYYQGTISSCLTAGDHAFYSVRQPDGATASIFAWEDGSGWWANLAVYSCSAGMIFETVKKEGPFESLDVACDKAGRLAGTIASRFGNGKKRKKKRRGDDDA